MSWQYFATLTFRGRVPSPPRAIRFAQEWLVGVAGVARVPFRRLLWVLRPEEGESFGRFHFHCLIAGVPSATPSFGFVIKAGWKHGFADVRMWEAGLGALDYIAEGLDGANVYESSKFVSHRSLILSESLKQVVGASLVTHSESNGVKQRENPCMAETMLAVRSGSRKEAGRFPLETISDPINGLWKTLAANASSYAVTVTQRADITGALKAVRI